VVSGAARAYFQPMIKKLVDLFKNPEAEVDLSEDEERAAVAALLVEAACADDDYADVERESIDRILASRYGLEPAGAERLRAMGEAARAEATDLVRFTQAIKKVVPHEERLAVIEAIWEIAYADGARDHTESALVRRLCGLLYVPDRDAGIARSRVKERLGID